MFDGLQRIEDIWPLLHPFLHGDDAKYADFARSGNYYEWYYSYAAWKQPKVIVEIGTLYGYSIISMLMGHPATNRVYLFDNCSYGVPIEEAVANVGRLWRGECIDIRLDTQSTGSLKAWLKQPADLIHVDGDHSPEGAYHDLKLVLPHLAEEGLIVLDDVDMIPELRTVGEAFAAANQLERMHIPTFRGHLLLSR